MPQEQSLPKAPTGIKGLDEVLSGGLPAGEMHLLEGGTGTGKTTLGLQFLMEGAGRGEKVAFITLAQTAAALNKVAASFAWSLDGIDVVELTDVSVQESTQQTLFRTADVELGETTAAIIDAMERLRPDRVVLDSVAQIRMLADMPLRYHRQLLSLREQFSRGSATVLIIDSPHGQQDQALADLSHGFITLDRNVPEYGNVRRRLTVEKMRGLAFNGGNHNFRIRDSGIEVFPRLEPKKGSERTSAGQVRSGIAGLDTLLDGGLEEGTAALVLGATGTGKSSVASLYLHAAAQAGSHSAVFMFDERPETFFDRSAGLGMDMRKFVEDGRITITPISTAELSPGEFSQMVRDAVEEGGARVVMMDSLTGYFHAMPQEDALVSQMHDLLTFLGRKGVLSLLVVSQHGLLGQTVQAPIDVSYMADTVILLRHFEAIGEVRKAISVIKKRQGPHETTIRELRMRPGSIEVGEPIRDFTGVLTGHPEFRGRPNDMAY